MKKAIKPMFKRLTAAVCAVGVASACVGTTIPETVTAEAVTVEKYTQIGDWTTGKYWVAQDTSGYNNIRVYFDNCSYSEAANDFEAGYNEKAKLHDSRSKNGTTNGGVGQIGSMRFDGIDTSVSSKYSVSFDMKLLGDKYFSNGTEDNDKSFQMHFFDSSDKYVNYFRINDGYIVLSLSGGSMGRYTTDNIDHKVVPYEVGKWTHMEYTVDTQTQEIKWYINGRFIVSGKIDDKYSSTGVTAKAILQYGDMEMSYEDFLEFDNFKTAYITEESIENIDASKQLLYNDYENETDWNRWLKGYLGNAARTDTEDSIHEYAANVKYKGIASATYDSMYFSGYTHKNDETGIYDNDFSDVYSISFDVKVPEETLGMYMRGLGYINNTSDGEQGFFGFIFDKTGYFGAGANWFGADVSSTTATVAQGKTKYKDNDWNAVDMVIDKTNKTVSVYLNGGLVKCLSITSTAAGTMVMKSFSLNALESESGFYIDNVRVVNIENRAFWYTAKFVGNKIVLDFNQQLVNQDLGAIKLYDDENNEIGVSAAVYDGHKVIITPAVAADYCRIEMPEHTMGAGGYLLPQRTVTVKKPRFKINMRLTANDSNVEEGEIDSIPENAEIKLVPTYENTTDVDKNILMIAAAYNKDGILTAISTKNGTATSGTEVGSFTEVPSFTLPAGTNMICGFLWTQGANGAITEGIVINNFKNIEAAISDENVKQLGRYANAAAGGRTYNWPGSGIEFKFSGTEAGINVTEVSGPYVSNIDEIVEAPTSDNCPYFTVEVDGEYYNRIGVSKTGWLTLASGLENREHTVKFTRSGEATRGRLSADKIRFLTDESSAAPQKTEAKARKLEFYGDSYTVGYANIYEPEEITVGGVVWETGKNTDFYNSFVGIAARAFDADVNVIAGSGKGIVKNGNGTDKTTITKQLSLADLKIRDNDADAPAEWNFDAYTPNAIVIFLGTNDHAASVRSNDFARGYSEFISELVKKYGEKSDGIKFILVTKTGLYEDAINTMLEDLGWSQNGQDNIYFYKFTQFPTDSYSGHPTKAQDVEIAKELAGFIKDATGWTYSEIK